MSAHVRCPIISDGSRIQLAEVAQINCKILKSLTEFDHWTLFVSGITRGEAVTH